MMTTTMMTTTTTTTTTSSGTPGKERKLLHVGPLHRYVSSPLAPGRHTVVSENGVDVRVVVGDGVRGGGGRGRQEKEG